MAESTQPPSRDIVLACCFDAEDLVTSFIDFHLNAGFDTVCLVDIGSSDATVEQILAHPCRDRIRLLVDARPGGENRRLEYSRLFAFEANRWVFFLEIDEQAVVPGGIKAFAASLPAEVTALRLRSVEAPTYPTVTGRIAWRADAEVRCVRPAGYEVEISPHCEYADDRLVVRSAFPRNRPSHWDESTTKDLDAGVLRVSPVVALELRESCWQCFCVQQWRRSEGHTSHEHLVLAKVTGRHLERWDQPVFEGHQGVAVRIHSECLFGDVFSGDACDCGWQLADALEQVEREGEGVIIYLRQEGRGIGLLDKIRSLAVPHPDSFVRNERIGHPGDQRGYTLAARLLRKLGVDSARLLSGNPGKIEALREAGIHVAEMRGRVSSTLSAEAAREMIAKVRRGYVYAAEDDGEPHGR